MQPVVFKLYRQVSLQKNTKNSCQGQSQGQNVNKIESLLGCSVTHIHTRRQTDGQTDDWHAYATKTSPSETVIIDETT